MRQLVSSVDRAISLASADNVNVHELQNQLFQIYSRFNRTGGGNLIINFPDKQKLAECFMFMLRYDWMHDSDIREVWAEDGFYCIVDAIQNNSRGEIGQCELLSEMFMLLRWGHKDLETKVNDILSKALIRHNPIFDIDDYNEGAKYVINQFAFLALNGMRPLAQIHGLHFIAGFMHMCDGNAYFQQISKLDFYKLNPMDVFDKMKFIASVIESILEDI